MLILLPPSEGKRSPRRGKPLNLSELSLPSLDKPRAEILAALVELCAADPEQAGQVLGLSAGLKTLVSANAALSTAPTARADHVYDGVLYDALGLRSMTPAAKRRATSRVLVTSSLFGVLRPGDRIPAYRLSGDASLPGVGAVAGRWREHLGSAIRDALGNALLVDLRSSTYAAFWRPEPELAKKVATVRVLQEQHGKRSVVSHFNKATKGRLVRSLLEDGANPGTPAALARDLIRLGWRVEVGTPDKTGTRLDVIVESV